VEGRGVDERAPLAAWGPPVPPAFLAPPDVVALARGEA